MAPLPAVTLLLGLSVVMSSQRVVCVYCYFLPKAASLFVYCQNKNKEGVRSRVCVNRFIFYHYFRVCYSRWTQMQKQTESSDNAVLRSGSLNKSLKLSTDNLSQC